MVRFAPLLVLLLALGCSGTRSLTPEEEEAFDRADRRGRVEVRVGEEEDGRPIAASSFTALRFALREVDVDQRVPIRVSRPMSPPVPNGIQTYELAEGWYRLRVSAPGYRRRWTPRFRVLAGKTVEAAVYLRPANLLVLSVVDETGAPVEGSVLLRGDRIEASLELLEGRGEMLVEETMLMLVADPEHLPGVRPGRLRVRLNPETRTEVTFRVRRE
jgi:hypothetical protein